MATLEIGLAGTASLVVGDEHTAAALGSGNVPVFSTPRLVALMEEAAVNALRGHLEAGQTSVGTRIDIAHLAATPIGGSVRADARLVAVNGRELTFEVTAFDDTGKIGEGSHRRAIVDERRFLERVGKKVSR